MKRTLELCLITIVLFSFGTKQSDSLPDFINENFSEVSEGTVHIYQTYSDTKGFTYEDKKEAAPIIVNTAAFFISKFEVTNKEYATFLEAVKNAGNQELLNKCKIDNSAWLNEVPYANGLIEHYHKHSAFSDHPVVNISHEGAMAYCEWLTEKVSNEMDSDKKISFRLPTREEWVRAARGDEHHKAYILQTTESNSSEVNCNYKYQEKGANLKESNTNSNKKVVVVGTMNRLKSNVTVTKPVKSYYSNAFDLYNIHGNVAEMIKERGIALGGSWASNHTEISINNQMEYNGPCPRVGFRPVMIIE